MEYKERDYDTKRLNRIQNTSDKRVTLIYSSPNYIETFPIQGVKHSVEYISFLWTQGYYCAMVNFCILVFRFCQCPLSICLLDFFVFIVIKIITQCWLLYPYLCQFYLLYLFSIQIVVNIMEFQTIVLQVRCLAS